MVPSFSDIAKPNATRSDYFGQEEGHPFILMLRFQEVEPFVLATQEAITHAIPQAEFNIFCVSCKEITVGIALGCFTTTSCNGRCEIGYNNLKWT